MRAYVCALGGMMSVRAGYLYRPVTGEGGGEGGGQERGGTWSEWATCCISAGNGSIIYCKRLPLRVSSRGTVGLDVFGGKRGRGEGRRL